MDDGRTGEGGAPSDGRTTDGRAAMSTASAARRAAAKAMETAVKTAQRSYDAIAPPVREAYAKTMRANAEYVVADETAAKKLGRQFVFTNLARIPPAMRHAGEEVKTVRGILDKARAGEVDMQTVAVGAVFAAEAYAWFCVGEIVGRGGKLTGY